MAMAEIRELLKELPNGATIASRDVIHLAPERSAVDMAMSRLNAAHEITRVAWGVYIKGDHTTPQPSSEEIARVKARDFNRIIAKVSTEFANQMGLPPPENSAETFATTGRSSRIWSSKGPIQFVGACMRKIVLADSLIGTELRTMWHMGRTADPAPFIQHAVSTWTETNWDECAARFRQLPEWLSRYLALPRFRPGSRQFLLE